jgi:TetR/AcrR family acrAB operon transcriptional repressor
MSLDGHRSRVSDNQERANRILDAAVKLIIRYGFDKTTVSDIAEEAGVSKGAVYLHWSSKDDLFEAMLWRESANYMDQWMERINADPEGGKLPQMYRHALLLIAESPLIQALMTRDKKVFGDYIRRGKTYLVNQRYGLGKEFISLLQSAGLVRADLDPGVITYVMNCFSYGMVLIDEAIPGNEAPPVDQSIAFVTEMLMKTVVPEGGSDSEAGKRILAQLVEAVKQRGQLDRK